MQGASGAKLPGNGLKGEEQARKTNEKMGKKGQKTNPPKGGTPECGGGSQTGTVVLEGVTWVHGPGNETDLSCPTTSLNHQMTTYEQSHSM